MTAACVNIFRSEEALDWLDDLFDERDIWFIHNTLEIIAEWPAGERPEVWDWLCALAAAEMLAAAIGKPSQFLPPIAVEWIDAYGFEADDEAMMLASKAIARIEETDWLADDAERAVKEWQNLVADLKQRLGATA